MKVTIKKSNRPLKKWMAEFETGRVVHFGATGYQDFTQHKDPERMKRYKTRHGSGRENHGKSGMYTAGFWSMWLLWNKPSLQASARDMEKRFGLKISFFKGRGSGTKSRQRTSRKVRSRKMKSLVDEIPDPDVLSNIMSYLPPSKVYSLASASSADRSVVGYFLNKQSKEYLDQYNMVKNMVTSNGHLNLSKPIVHKAYMDLDDSDNTLGVKTMALHKLVKLITEDGRKVIPEGVDQISFYSRAIDSDIESQSWYKNYFYNPGTLTDNIIINEGELPNSMKDINHLSRLLVKGSLPQGIVEVDYEEFPLKQKINLDIFPETIDEIKLTIEDLDNYVDHTKIPESLRDSITIVSIDRWVNPDDGEIETGDETELTIDEAVEALNRRDE